MEDAIPRFQDALEVKEGHANSLAHCWAGIGDISHVFEFVDEMNWN